ncbi:MAG TPA: YciI family protein [Terriglobales bacterium]|jgi:hypothetical protein
MKFMVIVKANKDSEAGVMPPQELFAAMNKYNEQLVKAGVMLAGEGLQSSSKGLRMKFDGVGRAITEGPFPETEQLIAGFWLWKVNSRQEAIDWLKRAPFDGGTEIELRQIMEMEDYGDAITPEMREFENQLRAEAEHAKS